MKAPTLTPAGFVAKLKALPSLPNVFNPWRDFDEENDSGSDAPKMRAEHLKCYR